MLEKGGLWLECWKVRGLYEDCNVTVFLVFFIRNILNYVGILRLLNSYHIVHMLLWSVVTDRNGMH